MVESPYCDMPLDYFPIIAESLERGDSFRRYVLLVTLICDVGHCGSRGAVPKLE